MHRSDEERIVELYDDVRRFAFVVADADIDADDLVHEVVVRTLSRSGDRPIIDMGAYLRRSIVNLASNRRRSAGRRRRAMSRLAMTDVSSPVFPSDLGDLDRLSALDRALLYLFVVEGRPHSEIARVMDRSEVSIRARSSRALRRLRVELSEEADHGDS